jgi:flagellar motor switch protein FliN/FliY
VDTETTVNNTETSITTPEDEAPETNSLSNLPLLMDVHLPVSIRFGETEMVLEEVIKLGVGSVIELNSAVDEPVELVVNGSVLARGEVVTVDGYYGIRITEITSLDERIRSLNA